MNPNTLDVAKTIATIDDYLKQKGCTLWQNWDITDSKERKEASIWLYSTLDELLRFQEARV